MPALFATRESALAVFPFFVARESDSIGFPFFVAGKVTHRFPAFVAGKVTSLFLRSPATEKGAASHLPEFPEKNTFFQPAPEKHTAFSGFQGRLLLLSILP